MDPDAITACSTWSDMMMYMKPPLLHAHDNFWHGKE